MKLSGIGPASGPPSGVNPQSSRVDESANATLKRISPVQAIQPRSRVISHESSHDSMRMFANSTHLSKSSQWNSTPVAQDKNLKTSESLRDVTKTASFFDVKCQSSLPDISESDMDMLSEAFDDVAAESHSDWSGATKAVSPQPSKTQSDFFSDSTFPAVPTHPLPPVMPLAPTHPLKESVLDIGNDLASIKGQFKEMGFKNKLAMLTDSQARQISRKIIADYESSNVSNQSIVQPSWSSASPVTPKNKQLLRLEKNVADLTAKFVKADKLFQKAADTYIQITSSGIPEKSREYLQAEKAFKKAESAVRQAERKLEHAQDRLDQAQEKLR